MLDEDVLLGQVIVRASALSGETVGKALAEVSRRRRAGQEADLASVLVNAKLLEPAQVEHFQRSARRTTGKAPADDDELTSTLRLAYESADPDLVLPGFTKPAQPARRASGVNAALPSPSPPRRPTGRFEAPPLPPPGPVPVLPAPPSNVSTTPSGRLIGRTWGTYEILNEVARGAMGAIYRARDKRRGGQEVALKVLLQGNKADPEDVERFKREARALQKLNHPAIVRFYEYGVHDGCPFVTMDFVAGTTLESIITGGGLSIDKGLVILEQVARAVDHAHSKGVVHRDLKPANVLIGNDNLARVTDFGLARILEEGGRLTRAGDLIGTPLYMSPEQIRGDLTALGPSSDVWSLGVTLYLLLTGEQPFGARTIEEVAKRVKNEEPVPPSKLRPEARIHEDLERICLTALAKDPKLRYQSAGEFANDLRAYLHGKPVLAGRVTLGMRLRRFYRSLRLKPLRVVGASLGLVLAVSGIALAMGRHGGAADRPQDPLARLEEVVSGVKKTKDPNESARALARALHETPNTGDETSARWRALVAMGHRDLAEHPPAGAEPALWKTRELLEAARTAPRASALHVDARTFLEAALEPLAQVHPDDALAALVDQAIENVGVANAPVAAGRAWTHVGAWRKVATVLQPLLDQLAGSDRDAAFDLVLDALLFLEDYEHAVSLARPAIAGARDGRQVLLLLATARALRGLPSADGTARERLDLLEKCRAETLAPDLRARVELEWTALGVDEGRPAAARAHLDAMRGLLEGDPRRIVLEASVAVLEGGTDATSHIERLDAVLAKKWLPPALLAEAAVARSELALLAGRADLAAGAVLPALPRPSASARRVALCVAAPVVVESLRALSAKLADPAVSAGRPVDSSKLVAAFEGLAPEQDRELAAWLYFALKADAKAPRQKHVAELMETGQASTNATRLGHLVELNAGSKTLLPERIFYSEDGKPTAGLLEAYLTMDPPSPAVERLVARAGDWIERARARIPLKWSAGLRPLPGSAHDELARADRLLELALRRDPFAAAAWRARATLAVVAAEVAYLETNRSPEPQALYADAAVAVLTAAYDAGSLAALARASVGAGDLPRAKLWAQRAAIAGRGDPSDCDRGLMDALLGTPPAADPMEASLRALLYALGRVPDDPAVRSRYEEAAAQSPPAPTARLDARGWALAALAWDGVGIDRCLPFDGPENPTEAPDFLLAAVRGVADALRQPAAKPARDGRFELEKVRRMRPRALAPRVYLALLAVCRGSVDDAACALEDLKACGEIAKARGSPESGLAKLGHALARARVEGTPFEAPTDPELEGLAYEAVLKQWKLHPAK